LISVPTERFVADTSLSHS